MEWQDGRIRSEAYWKLPVASPSNWSLPDACQALDSLLRQSIREHLISDVPLGMWLSGGVDSSTILHYAATESGSPLKTFSISFRGRSFDETRYIRTMVERYGTDHQEMDLNPDVDLIGAVEEFTELYVHARFGGAPCETTRLGLLLERVRAALRGRSNASN